MGDLSGYGDYSYDEGYASGYDEGYASGYDEGYASGYEEGYDAGWGSADADKEDLLLGIHQLQDKIVALYAEINELQYELDNLREAN